MEELHYVQEIMMLPEEEERVRRVRRNLFEELSEKEFVALTRFTKEGVRTLKERLDVHPRSENGRGQPVSPADQVQFIQS